MASGVAYSQEGAERGAQTGTGARARTGEDTGMSELTLLRHIEAWRFWEPIGEKDCHGQPELALVSLGHAYIWPPGEAAEATCGYCPAFQQDCAGAAGEKGMPTYNCPGGLYGYKSKAFALKDPAVSDGNAILGKVALWGRITEHEK